VTLGNVKTSASKGKDAGLLSAKGGGHLCVKAGGHLSSPAVSTTLKIRDCLSVTHTRPNSAAHPTLL